MPLLPLNAMMLTFVIGTSLHYFMVLPSNCVSFQARKVLPSNCVFSFKLEIMYPSLPSFLSLFLFLFFSFLSFFNLSVEELKNLSSFTCRVPYCLNFRLTVQLSVFALPYLPYFLQTSSWIQRLHQTEVQPHWQDYRLCCDLLPGSTWCLVFTLLITNKWYWVPRPLNWLSVGKT